MNQQHYTGILIICLVLFSIFRRVRRNIGWQQLNPKKMTARITIFCIIGLLFLAEGVLHPISLLSDAVGILIGVVLAYYGAGMTQFEKRDGKLYYRPNTWIGSIVTAIFFGRLIYRFYEMYAVMKSGNLQANYSQNNGFQNMGFSASDPWTAGLMLIMFAYYTVYFIFLLRKQKQASQTISM
jgi:hypothetical protein